MLDILYRLKKWRLERGLDKSQGFEFDLNIQLSFITEKTTEYLRANNEYEKVDALCDITIFCINGASLIKEVEMIYDLISANGNVDIYDILYEISTINNDFIHHAFLNCIDNCILMINDLGYDFYKCMDETLKKIESRTGAINKETGKWEKFKTDEAKSKWYKADYSKCKLKDNNEAN